MASTAAALLDELMGRDRNLAPTEKRKEIKWDDPSVIYNVLIMRRNSSPYTLENKLYSFT